MTFSINKKQRKGSYFSRVGAVKDFNPQRHESPPQLGTPIIPDVEQDNALLRKGKHRIKGVTEILVRRVT